MSRKQDDHIMSGYNGHNRAVANGGPQGVQRSYASALQESEALFSSYEHLQGLPRGDAALTMLRKVASLVKPIMRKRNWHVQILAEFLPPEQRLLGLNINRGFKICIRLRYHNNPDLFLPMEHVVDTMLHELSHNVWGEHDSRFHALWEELRDEHETLVRKGYTGEGFLSAGHRLGGGRADVPSLHETRRLARASAEKRRAQNKLTKGSGQRLGGTPLHLQGGDVRKVIADQVTRRNTINIGCASGRRDANQLSDQSASQTYKTKADEDDANNRAIAQALFELMEQEEEQKLNGTFSAPPTDGGLAWDPEHGLFEHGQRPELETKPRSKATLSPLSEEEQMKWALQASTSRRISGNSPGISPLTPEQTTAPANLPLKPFAPTPPQLSSATTKPTSRLAQDARKQMLTNIKQESNAIAHPASSSAPIQNPIVDISEPFNPSQWACEICTCINPVQFLSCDACGIERPPATTVKQEAAPQIPNAPRWALPKEKQTRSLGWNCGRCGTFMEHKWWTCSACGSMKDTS